MHMGPPPPPRGARMYVLCNSCGLQVNLSTLTMHRNFLRLFVRQYKNQHNYSIMGNLHNIVIVVGLSSLALLWVFSIAGALLTVWDTLGEHTLTLIERLKR